MKPLLRRMSITAVLVCLAGLGWGAGPSAAPDPPDSTGIVWRTAPGDLSSLPPVDEVLNLIQQYYGTSGFCQSFGQVATLTGMGIQDSASGMVCFLPPDKMRWHYEEPEEQTIVSDGTTLWIHRPVDNQVLVGRADDFFGAGEGASFFSDVKMLKSGFDVAWADGARQEEAARQNAWALTLTPKQPSPEFTSLHLLVDRESHRIVEAASYNNFGDETRIRFSTPDFNTSLKSSDFAFTMPPGVDIMELAPPNSGS